MNNETVEKFIKSAKNHYWDSLEKDKDLIILHLEALASLDKEQKPEKPNAKCQVCGYEFVLDETFYCPKCKPDCQTPKSEGEFEEAQKTLLKWLHDEEVSIKEMHKVKLCLDAQQGQIEQLKNAILKFGNNPAGFDWAVLDEIDKLQAENKKLSKILEMIVVYNENRSQYIIRNDMMKKIQQVIKSQEQK